MVQVIEQGDIFGQVGKSFGEGLSKTLPAAIDRKIFSKEIKSIREQGLSGSDLAVALSNTRGTDEQKRLLYNTISDESYVRSIPSKESGFGTPPGQDESTGLRKPTFESTSLESGVSPVESKPTQVEEFEGEERFATEPVSLVDEHLEEKLREGRKVYTPDQVDIRAAELWKTERGKFREFDDAIKRAKEEFESENKEYDRIESKVQLQEKQQASYEKRYDDGLTLITQKAGFEDLSGENKLTAKQNILKEIKAGKEPQKAIAEWIRRSKNLATAKNEMSDFSDAPMVGRLSEKNIDRLKSWVAPYKEFGAQRELVKDLMSKVGVASPLANSIAFDTSKEVQSLLNKLPKNKLPELRTGFTKLTAMKDLLTKKLSDSQKEDFAKNIKKTDSIPAIQLVLSDLNYDDLDFVEYLRDKTANNQFKPNDRQASELRTTDKVAFTLDETFAAFMSGLWKSPGSTISTQWKRSMGQR